MRTIDRAIVHHTGGPEWATVPELAAIHKRRFGAVQVGYHHVVRRPAGRPWTVEAGRPEELIGAHDKGENSSSIGIAICGDFTRGPIDPAGWLVLAATVADVCRRYELASSRVYGHRDNEPAHTATKCPGFRISELRPLVAALLGEREAPVWLRPHSDFTRGHQ